MSGKPLSDYVYKEEGHQDKILWKDVLEAVERLKKDIREKPMSTIPSKAIQRICNRIDEVFGKGGNR